MALFPDGGYHIRSLNAVGEPNNTHLNIYATNLSYKAYHNVPKAIGHRAESCGGLANIYDIEFDSTAPTRYLFQTVHQIIDGGGIQHGSLPHQFVDAIIASLDVAIQDYAIGNANAWYMNGGNTLRKCWMGNTSEYFDTLVKAKPVHASRRIVC